MLELVHDHDRFEIRVDEDHRLLWVRWKPCTVDKPALQTYFELAQPILDHFGRVLHYTHFCDVEGITMGARLWGAKRIREQKPYIKKSALYGTGPVETWMFDHFIRLTGRRDVQLFATEEAALAWLLIDRGDDDKAADTGAQPSA